MADYLGKFSKDCLLALASELGVSVAKEKNKKEICRAIVSASDYDEKFTYNCAEQLAREEQERKEREKQEALERKEREKQEKDREMQEALERKDRENREALEKKERERLQFEMAEREKERVFELEKLRLMNSSEASSISSNASVVEVDRVKRVNLKDLVPKFEPKVIDITLFLLIFERQAEKAKIASDDWVSQLIPLLPTEIAEIIVREPADKNDDYSHIKKILLKRFKLTTGALRQKFEGHQRKPGALWSDLVYELRGYLDNWLESAEIQDFDALKELMLVEQVKRRVPFEIKEKYMDEWEDLRIATTLAEKCDRYESIKGNFRKTDRKNGENKSFQENKDGEANSKFKNEIKSKPEASNEGEEIRNDQGRTDRGFEKRKPIQCYLCKKFGHIRPNCPELAVKSAETINHVIPNIALGECFQPYLKQAEINGVKRMYLRDTGASLDLCDSTWVKPEDFIGEKIWVRQPLDDQCKSLPLAWITIKGEFGTVKTKAAIIPSKLEQGYYLLGNKTAELIANRENVSVVNAVFTCSKTFRTDYNKIGKGGVKSEHESQIAGTSNQPNVVCLPKSDIRNSLEINVASDCNKEKAVSGLGATNKKGLLFKEKLDNHNKDLRDTEGRPSDENQSHVSGLSESANNNVKSREAKGLTGELTQRVCDGQPRNKMSAWERHGIWREILPINLHGRSSLIQLLTSNGTKGRSPVSVSRYLKTRFKKRKRVIRKSVRKRDSDSKIDRGPRTDKKVSISNSSEVLFNGLKGLPDGQGVLARISVDGEKFSEIVFIQKLGI